MDARGYVMTWSDAAVFLSAVALAVVVLRAVPEELRGWSGPGPVIYADWVRRK